MASTWASGNAKDCFGRWASGYTSPAAKWLKPIQRKRWRKTKLHDLV